VIRETVGHLRDLPRYRQILSSLVRYGYQDVVAALHLEGIVRPLERVALGSDIPPADRPRRLKLVCEDLGPTFVKLGQVLSTRPDLLPEAYTNELASLRDDVRPFPFEQAEAILKAEYGRPLADLFTSIDPTAVASASISQVHRAVLLDARVVALKIRRPDIAKVVRADLDIIKNLAQLVERRLPNLAVYRPMALAGEFERTINRELDFTVERRTIQRCRTQFKDDPSVHVLAVIDEISTVRVLAMEFIEGVPVNNVEAIRAMSLASEDIAAMGARLLFKQVFQFGFFHADPHPGNLRVLPGGIIAPLDFGMFGQLEPRTRERMADLLSALVAQDSDRVLRSLDALDVRGRQIDSRAFRRDIAEIVSSYADLSLETIDLSLLLRELFAVIRTHRLHIPPDIVLLIRALVTIESVARNLDPHFDIAAQLAPFLRDLSLRRFRPARLLGQALRTTEDVQRITTLLPDLLGQALDSISKGQFRVHFDLQGFERLVRQLTRASNSLAVGIVASGLFVASSIVLRVGSHSLAYAGFSGALVLCLWLLWNMSRSDSV
jgi:ubiquinone biosynthesis protein